MKTPWTIRFLFDRRRKQSLVVSANAVFCSANQENSADECITLEKSAIDPNEIQFLGSVLVKKRCSDEWQRPVINSAKLSHHAESDERHKCQKMQELRQTQASRDSKFYNKRSNIFPSIEIVILRRINQIEPCDPANYACREHNRSKIDPTSLRDPCTDRCNGQREAEKEVRCARESFCDGIEKNPS